MSWYSNIRSAVKARQRTPRYADDSRRRALEYYHANKTECKAKCKAWKLKNAERVKVYTKRYYWAHRDTIRKCSELFYKNNKKKILKYFKTRYWKNHAEMLEYMRAHRRIARKRNPEKYREYSKRYYYANQARLLKRRRDLYHERKRNEIQ